KIEVRAKLPSGRGTWPAIWMLPTDRVYGDWPASGEIDNGVDVLNINELANTLKPVVIPGEKMTVTPVKQGKDSSQAIAYLDDGTMVVVEDGRKAIGETTEITVTSVLQTSAGRMIFGRIKMDKK
ncbi:MAG: family 16 glycosylhydrolase, partial [Firmicutes bacterium]|nr:family 16 glycosylhydrolase [Bacillota bacterium]